MRRVFTMFLQFFLSCILVNSLAASSEGKKVPSAVVVGTVYCDACSENVYSETSGVISGANVAIECGHEDSSKPTFRKETKTNENGEFKVDLPMSVSKSVKNIKGCSVKLISSGESFCAVASTGTSSSNLLRLKSRSKQGIYTFSAGIFTFKPLKQPSSCNKNPSITKKVGSGKTLLYHKYNPAFVHQPTIKNMPPLLNQKVELLPTLPLPPISGITLSPTTTISPHIPITPNIPITPLPGLPGLLPGVPGLPGLPKIPGVLGSSLASGLPGIPPVAGLPTPGLPGIPPVAGLPTPGLPGIPPVAGLPTPGLPGIPPVAGSPTPGLPGIPPVAGLPTPGLPGIPPVAGLPTPGLPGIPPVAGLPTPGLPGIPPVAGLPTPGLPGIPPVPGLPGNPPASSSPHKATP